MKKIAIIPARGGSKRLPGKNVKKLGEIPLLAHSILYAQNSKEIDRVLVSTDSDEIKHTAEKWNAEVIDRPEELAGDYTPTVEVLKHVLMQIEIENSDYVITLQPTNPLRPAGLLEEALAIFREKHLDSLFTVSENRHKLGKIINDRFQPFNYAFGQRSQDMEKLYYENGLLYITRADVVLDGNIITENAYPMTVSHPFALVDIDTQEDFDYASYLLNKQN
ncbi:acylneuraminate cytidylyltransferase family protein [Riemerella columbipharyngis]|uniref:N-acylneuraminate cytidylyltransferase n=1 Tax=Riemerella columbipharyngis TaxID=1071918 RepID=A0A1G7EB73_9FLAO|nr:acylneuraminate cytidylyltransferase family protein [Riemerella columbipharyngis]SDE60893.1 N-acylneuraminate cytidylyltransferase [Riemerella columbipharyngis]